MSNYYLTIDKEDGEPLQVHGPYPSYIDAYKAAEELPDAEKHGRIESHAEIPICDFCSDKEIGWRYPADDIVELSVMWGSSGDWAACDTCHDLIEADDRKGLTERSVDRFYIHHPGMVPDTPDARRMMFQEISQLHAAFFIARSGKVQREVKENPHERDTDARS